MIKEFSQWQCTRHCNASTKRNATIFMDYKWGNEQGIDFPQQISFSMFAWLFALHQVLQCS